jgi:hypothetical protein
LNRAVAAEPSANPGCPLPMVQGSAPSSRETTIRLWPESAMKSRSPGALASTFPGKASMPEGRAIRAMPGIGARLMSRSLL